MDIKVKIRKIFENEAAMKALASITLDDVLAVHDIKIIKGPTRLFVAMPSRKCKDGIFMDIVHPINAAMRRKIEEAVIGEYERYMAVAE